jgi:hypothetical protein
MPNSIKSPKERKELPNITAQKTAFDALLGKLLKAPPLPKAAIAPKQGRAKKKADKKPH